jgi:acyl-CoA reductase-like NAD-dependent aldehyde dehydrogenase
MARLAPARRADVLDTAARLALTRRDEFARVIALELGKPLRDGLGELDRVATRSRCARPRPAASAATSCRWRAGRAGSGNTALTYRAPAGVALAITPFNAPANLLAHKLGASFAAGNTTIVKAPPQAPAVSAAIVALLLEAGAPTESVQLLHGDGDVGAACARCPRWPSSASPAPLPPAPRSRVRPAPSGWSSNSAATPRRSSATMPMLRQPLESAPGPATPTPARAASPSNGSTCTARVTTSFVEALTAEVGRLVVGDPLDPGTDVGSMVDDAAAERVVSWAGAAVEAGASITIGGRRDGATVFPTVVAGPPADAAVVVHEVFGALVAVLPYDDFDDVIGACNASRFGLQAGLFTRDIGRILTAWRELQVGGLVVNGSSNFRLDHVPFGGVKDSGFGRESPQPMIEDFTVVKTLLLRDMSIWGEQS